MFDLFDKVIEFNHNPSSESAKRKLDLVRMFYSKFPAIDN